MEKNISIDPVNPAVGAARRSLFSGTISAFVIAFAAGLAGKHEGIPFSAPLNAISHILWGEKAAHKDNLSLKYTLTGFMLNHGAAVFWAFLYERIFGKQTAKQPGTTHLQTETSKTSLMKPILGAAAITAGAYIIDYHFIPKRLTPGFEKRLSSKKLAIVFVIMAMGLAARDVIDATKVRQKN